MNTTTATTEITETAEITGATTTAPRRTARLRTAGLTLLATLVAVAAMNLGSVTPASATTVNVSQKVCAQNASGHVIAGATLISWYYNGTKWVKFATGTTSSTGCGWVSAPRNRTTTVEIWHLHTNGCLSIGYNLWDDGYTTSRVYSSTASDGINLGWWKTGYYYQYC